MPRSTAPTSHIFLLEAQLNAFASRWGTSTHPSNEKYHKKGRDILGVLLDEELDVRPFPASAFAPLVLPPGYNPSALACADVAKEKNPGVLMARMATTQTVESLGTIAHRACAAVKATEDGLGQIPIGLPLPDSDVSAGVGQGQNAYPLSSTIAPGFHVTQLHCDYDAANTSVHHFDGIKLWIVVPYTPKTAPVLTSEKMRIHRRQDTAKVLRQLPYVYAAVIEDPTSFVLSPLDYHAVLSLTPSVHCGGKVLIRGETAVFRKAQDYARRLLAFSKRTDLHEDHYVYPKQVADKEAGKAVQVVQDFGLSFGLDALYSKSADWDEEIVKDSFYEDANMLI
jgi:hypothetical protein